jgi:hypothetical protein
MKLSTVDALFEPDARSPAPAKATTSLATVGRPRARRD